MFDYTNNITTLLTTYIEKTEDNEETIKNYTKVINEIVMDEKDTSKQLDILLMYLNMVKENSKPKEIIEEIVFKFFRNDWKKLF